MLRYILGALHHSHLCSLFWTYIPIYIPFSKTEPCSCTKDTSVWIWTPCTPSAYTRGTIHLYSWFMKIQVVQLCSPQDSSSHWEEGGDHKCTDTSHSQLKCCKLSKVYLVPLSSRERSVETFWKEVIIWTSYNCFTVPRIFLECMKFVLAAASRVKGYIAVVFIW